MTTLLCAPLKTTLTQFFTIEKSNRSIIGGLYPYILMNNAPTGTFHFKIISGTTTIFQQNFTSASIKTALSTTNNYCHVWLPLVATDIFSLENGSYKAELSSTGYTYSDSSYLAWIQPHEDVQTEIDYTPIDDTQKPLGLRIKEYKEGIYL